MNNRYFILDNTFLEVDRKGNVFLLNFKENRLEHKLNIDSESLILMEEKSKWVFEKELNNRIKFFNKFFK